MDYAQQHLLNWLQEHTLIKISGLEEAAGIRKDTIRHFLKERRVLVKAQYDLVVDILENYGYSPSK